MPADGLTLRLLVERSTARSDQISEVDIAVVVTCQRQRDVAPTKRSINLALVIDKSGSMDGNKLDQAKGASVHILQNMGHADRLTVIAFDNEVVELVTPQTPASVALGRINALTAGGGTDLARGWYSALIEIQTYATAEHVNRIVLLSDGQANSGEQKTSVLEHESARARDEAHVTTSTIGIGKDFQEDVLVALSSASGGRFWFIEEARIEEIMKEEFSGALSVVLERPRVELVCPVGVKVTEELNTLPKIAQKYRLRPLKGHDELSFAARLHIDPKQMDSDVIQLRAVLYDGEGVVDTTETNIRLVAVDEHVTSPQELQVLHLVHQFRATTAEEAIADTYSGAGRRSMHDMLRIQAEKLQVCRHSLPPESSYRSVVELDREILESEALMPIVQLMQLLQGVGRSQDADALAADARKLHKLRAARRISGHQRETADDWVIKSILEDALAHASKMIADFPSLEELESIRNQINEKLAELS